MQKLLILIVKYALGIYVFKYMCIFFEVLLYLLHHNLSYPFTRTIFLCFRKCFRKIIVILYAIIDISYLESSLFCFYMETTFLCTEMFKVVYGKLDFFIREDEFNYLANYCYFGHDNSFTQVIIEQKVHQVIFTITCPRIPPYLK